MPADTKRPYTRPEPPTLILRDAIYSLAEFKKASGLGSTSIANAKERGVELKTYRVGRLKFVRGADAITFIESAAVLEDAP